MTSAYPLCWPAGWNRTKYPRRARFDSSFACSVNGILRELRLLGGSSVVISTNVELKQDGLPYANRSNPSDSGVVVYFRRNNRDQCIPCDKWDRTSDNLHAIELTIAAIRGMDRWGAKDFVDAAFRGFEALPAPDQITPSNRYFDDCTDLDHAKGRFQRLAKELHPDMGGNPAEFSEMKSQFDQIRLSRGWSK